MLSRLLVDGRCGLGEGVCWDQAAGRVLYVDIHGCAVHAYHPVSGAVQTWASPQRIGWLIPRQGQPGFVAGLQEGFASVVLGDAAELDITWLNKPFEGRASLRLNDAKADQQGRIWAGSLNNDAESQPDGVLFRLLPDGSVGTVDTGYCVANGPAISPDGRTLLHTDSARKTIYAFDLDGASGALSNKRIWKVLGPDEGYPDGMNFDAQGCLWLAHWGAGCVSRFDLTGQLLARVQLPASQITNVAFGGAQLDRLFVTTARVGLSDAQLALEPHAGGLFEVLGHGATGLLPLAYQG